MSKEDIKEIIVITVTKEYYSQHIDIFKNENVKVRSVYVEGENHEDDIIHKKLLKKYTEAQKELRDYEFYKRNK